MGEGLPTTSRQHRIGPKSVMLAESWWYEPTYLSDDDDRVWLFVRHLMEYRTPSGRLQRKRVRDVLEFETSAEMVGAVLAHGMKELPEDAPDDWWPDANGGEA